MMTTDNIVELSSFTGEPLYIDKTHVTGITWKQRGKPRIDPKSKFDTIIYLDGQAIKIEEDFFTAVRKLGLPTSVDLNDPAVRKQLGSYMAEDFTADATSAEDNEPPDDVITAVASSCLLIA